MIAYNRGSDTEATRREWIGLAVIALPCMHGLRVTAILAARAMFVAATLTLAVLRDVQTATRSHA